MRAGFRAAYEPYDPDVAVPGVPVAGTIAPGLPQDAVRVHHGLVPEQQRRPSSDRVPPAAERGAVPPVLPAGGEAVPGEPRAPLAPPAPRSLGRALGGAALSLAGVALGIATLLWATDDPPTGLEPDAPAPAAQVEPAEVRLPDPLPPSGAAPTAPVVPAPVVPAPAAPGPSPVLSVAPPTTPVPPAVTVPPPAAAPVVVPVTVLNNSRITGLAARGAEQFRDGGWPVAATGNLRGRLRATTVYYPAGLEASARAFAERFPGVARVLPRPQDLPGSGLTVVLTRDFAGS